MGYDFTAGRIFDFPIDFSMGYNSAALMRCLWCTWTSCLRILTKSPQQFYKPASSGLSAIAELLVFFVCPGDPPVAITQNVAWMKRQVSACQTFRSMYPFIFNSFPVIRTTSAKNRRFHVPQPTFFFPLEKPLWLSRNMLHEWKDNSMLAKPLAACTYHTLAR